MHGKSLSLRKPARLKWRKHSKTSAWTIWPLQWPMKAADLRKAGISSAIMIMNPELTAFKTMFDYRLEPEVYSFHLLEELIKAAEREGVTNFPIHIKIDTGMHRLGFSPEEIPQLVERLPQADGSDSAVCILTPCRERFAKVRPVHATADRNV